MGLMCTPLAYGEESWGSDWMGAAAHPNSSLILHSRIQLVEHMAEPLA